MKREKHVEALKTEEFDLLVIGGGATGAGVALDAASRGHKVALVEAQDFSAGTSSRSTKLIHGGVRYLEAAVKRFDRSQFNLVRDALAERATLLKLAPHLSKPLPLVTPLYNWLEVPYFMTGLKLYDWLAGKANLHPSKFVDAKEALNRFPMLEPKGLRGAVIYYDGQFDDSRMNLAIAQTATEYGAYVANHVRVTGLIKQNAKVVGANLKDEISGESWQTKAKIVINATGPFTDNIRKMDDPNATTMVTTSSGVHIVLNKEFSPPDTALLIPETEDGRVLFLLPWQGKTLVGTTDNPAKIEENPKASEDDINYILRHVDKYFSIPVTRKDVKSAWSGLRPLVSDPNAADTAKLSRDHIINVSDSGLLTIAGGKWTTYRKMAEDVVDHAEEIAKLGKKDAITETLILAGGKDFSPENSGKLQEKYGFDFDIASHLNYSYGDRATMVADIAADGYAKRLRKNFPYLEAEVVYGARYESARNSQDILCRRTRLSFLSTRAALKALPKVNSILAKELNWSDEKAARDLSESENYLK